MSIKKRLEKLKNKARRDLFVAGQIKTGIPFQVRAMRDKKDWTQARLGTELGMTQTNVSRLESPGYGRLNITTLQRIASVFDVALVVRFVPFSELFRWTNNLSPEDIAPVSFDEEIESLEASSLTATYTAPIRTHVIPGTLLRQLEEIQVGVVGMGSSVWAVAPKNLGFNNLAGYWRAYRTNIASTVEELAAAAAGVNDWPYFSDVVTEASAVTEETDMPTSVADILKHVNSDTNVINYPEREAA